MNFPVSMLESAHTHCAAHRNELFASQMCGCFDCRKVFAPSEIMDWLEERRGPLSQQPDPWTARCPNCGTDSVIGDASGFPASDPAFLEAMHRRWFGRTVPLKPTMTDLLRSLPDRVRGWLTQKTI